MAALGHKCTGAGPAQRPAAIAPPGVQAAGVTDAVMQSRAVDPAQRYQLTALAALPIVPASGPAVPPPGTPRQATHPALAGLIRQERVLGPVTGVHGELAAGAATPDGDMLPFERKSNTWRAAPQPWDTGVYAGQYLAAGQYGA